VHAGPLPSAFRTATQAVKEARALPVIASQAALSATTDVTAVSAQSTVTSTPLEKESDLLQTPLHDPLQLKLD
jgi:hypothetical protein